MINVEVAELKAGFEALRFAIEAGFWDVQLEGDNLSMVSALWNKSENLINGGVIVSDILSLAQSCYVCAFSFVKREGNSVEYALALFLR